MLCEILYYLKNTETQYRNFSPKNKNIVTAVLQTNTFYWFFWSYLFSRSLIHIFYHTYFNSFWMCKDRNHLLFLRHRNSTKMNRRPADQTEQVTNGKTKKPELEAKHPRSSVPRWKETCRLQLSTVALGTVSLRLLCLSRLLPEHSTW